MHTPTSRRYTHVSLTDSKIELLTELLHKALLDFKDAGNDEPISREDITKCMDYAMKSIQ